MDTIDVEEIRAIHSRYIAVIMQINDLDKRDEARPALMEEAKNLSIKLNLIGAGEVLLVAFDRLKVENERLRQELKSAVTVATEALDILDNQSAISWDHSLDLWEKVNDAEAILAPSEADLYDDATINWQIEQAAKDGWTGIPD